MRFRPNPAPQPPQCRHSITAMRSPGLSLLLTMSLLTPPALTPTSAAPLAPIQLWPGKPPGETTTKGPEADTSKPGDNQVAGKPVIRLGNVSQPTVTLYRPDPSKDTGTTVLVCPGGGYYILAMDLEGTEVCEWLNSVGVSAALLKYRVPRANRDAKPVEPLQDAQRALSLLRHDAGKFGIRPDRIGVLGFSAGGHLAAALSTGHGERRYRPIDVADAVSCRPDFSVLIYPAYLTDKDRGDAVAADLPVTTNTPPTFISISQDDPVRVENALGYAAALQKAQVPMELHVYPKGGHGYGLRRTAEPVTTWSDRATDWMRSRGWLERR